MPVFPGVSIGPAVVYRKTRRQDTAICGTPQEELARFESACQEAAQQLSALYENAKAELGADPKLTETFIEMGFTELSMAPGRILETRKIVCESQA